MKKNDRIEHPAPGDYKEILSFLSNSYNHSYHFFPLRYPALSAPDTFDYDNTFIIRKEKKIVSLVRIFPQTAVLSGRTVEIGGIGSVATHPDFRKKGYMQQLMTHCVQEMQKRNYAFSILAGDRQRYNFWDFETCGNDIRIAITNRSIAKGAMPAPLSLQQYHGNRTILQKIARCHASQPLFIKRNARTFRAHFEETIHTNLWYAEEKKEFAYMAGIGERRDITIVEFGGSPSLWPRMLSTLISRYSLTLLALVIPPIHLFINAFLPFASSYSITTTGMIRILSLEATMNFLLGDTRPKEWKFSMYTGSTCKKISSDDKTLHCSAREWAQILFGPVSPIELPAPLKGLFPSVFSWPLIDHI
ncbi:MAG: GNAT family N-acetyltransferase [Candidatus Ratteibacteria bacterium]|jgi:predicted N-acetyltransferase YhbS